MEMVKALAMVMVLLDFIIRIIFTCIIHLFYSKIPFTILLTKLHKGTIEVLLMALLFGLAKTLIGILKLIKQPVLPMIRMCLCPLISEKE